ncbi:MAG: 50S ribosomal protein L25 [Acidobacteria bacterium]|nr:50S ribosomal protein L25 [Acidobacteriota bacterium]
MQLQIEMDVQPREGRGKNAARRVRAAGQVPAILYGLGKEPVAISFDAKQITKLLQSPSGHNQIVNVKVSGGETAAAMASDWLVDPVRGNLLHVDMRRTDLTHAVEVSVAVVIVGVSHGVRKEGGHDEVVTREIELRALPLEVPQKIEIDVTEMVLGSAFRVADLPASDTYTVLTRAEQVLVHCVAQKVAEEEKPAEEVVEAVPAGAGKSADGAKDKGKDKGKEG